MNEVDELRNSLESVYGYNTEQAVERLIGIYEHAKSLQSALDEIGKGAKNKLSEIMAETGQMDWKTQSGRCYVTKPSIAVRYDRKGLDKLAAHEPDMTHILAPYRTESERPGVLTIRAARS